MLKGAGRIAGAKLWPVACLGGRPQCLLLCVCDKAPYHGAGVQPADCSTTEIGLYLAASVASPCLKIGVTKEVFQAPALC